MFANTVVYIIGPIADPYYRYEYVDDYSMCEFIEWMQETYPNMSPEMLESIAGTCPMEVRTAVKIDRCYQL